ncbi:MAG TPA: hypothetical protein VER75_09855, partial [Thermoleophilaceae bacterium]|nr:hypothetical protein [Thermoleophilaceae bacterium]
MAPFQDVAADEARLAERAVAGDGSAFAELYGRYEQRAYNLCLRILGSDEEAADATQDASDLPAYANGQRFVSKGGR